MSGQASSHSLAIPMILLNVICELRRYNGDNTLYESEADACIAEVLLHVNPDLRIVLETVGPKGELGWLCISMTILLKGAHRNPHSLLNVWLCCRLALSISEYVRIVLTEET